MVMIMTGLTCIIGLVMYAVYANADLSRAREIQLSNTVIESGSIGFLPTHPKRREN